MPRTSATTRFLVRDFGTSLSFSGTATDRVTIPHSSSQLYTDSISVSAWIYPTSYGPTGAGRILDKTPSSNSGFSLLMDGTNRTIRAFLGTTLYTANTNAIFSLSRWYHVMMTFDRTLGSNQIKFYVNGALAGVGTRTSAITSNALDMYIGNINNGINRSFGGLIDEVKVYSTGLTSAQALDEYLGRNRLTIGLVLYSKFDEASGTATIDSAGIQSNGTITGAVYSTNVRFKPRRSATVLGLQFDGTQNYLSLGSMGALGSNLSSGFYASFTMRTTATATQCIIGGGNAGSTTAVLVFINAVGGGALSSKKMRIFLRDNTGKTVDCGTTNTYNWNDGAAHTFVITAIGSTNTVTVTIDGVSQAITYTTTTTPATFANFTHTLALGARDNAGSIGSYANVLLKNVSIGTSAGALYGVYALTENVNDSSGNANNGSFVGTPNPYFFSRRRVI